MYRIVSYVSVYSRRVFFRTVRVIYSSTPHTTQLCHLQVTYVDSKGERVTTETAYLTEDVLARPNLKIATNATVTRILFSETSETIRAVGIEFVNKEGSRFQAKALKEVVLS